MKLKQLHEWDLSIAQARQVQERLARRVRQTPLTKEVRHIAGTDVSYHRPSGLFVAGVVVLRWPSLETIETQVAAGETPFPYVPGYLSFREIPPLALALEKVRTRVDLMVCDGQGLAHPRGLGLASHLGLLTGLPTIGCAKSRLCGEHREPAARRGSSVALNYRGETLGRVLRTRDGVRPLFVSVGHNITLAEAEKWVLRLANRTRIPEPTKRADHLVGLEMRKLQNL
ncbi:MAG: deoxyribonuclease V [Chrysiogenetes bacterium]|nr:deoxyribonuclease V [Chrysiogenetes bacterium]